MVQAYKVTPPGGDIHCPTLIEFILDETGSMSSCINGALAGFNAFIDEQRSIAGECLFTLTKFNSRGLRTPYQDLSLIYVPRLSRQTYIPYSTTNLYDAIGNRIDAVDARIRSWTVKPKVLIVVLTDGCDNASLSHSVFTVSNRVSSRPEWCFVYLGSDDRALDTARNLGFMNAKRFETRNIEKTFAEISASTTAYRAGSNQAFFG